MKTNIYLSIVAAAACCVSSAWATHQTYHPAAPQARGTNNTPAAEEKTDTPGVWKVVGYPFRAGYTIIRTPLLIGETFTGKRTFISDHGLFQMNEDAKSGPERGMQEHSRQHMARP